MDTKVSTGHHRAQALLLRHWAIILLLALLAALSTRTLGVYLVSDDLRWIERTVADAPRPWNIFVEPLFGEYYRPMPHLAWLVNYYLWGFNITAHQVMFLLLWLGAVALVYAVGARFGGRIAGVSAAAVVGLNDITMLLASWRSWYTTLVEFAAVLAWALAYHRWFEARRRRRLVAWIVLAAIAVISRELAPLILSAGIFVTLVLPKLPKGRMEWHQAAKRLLLWAIITAAVLLVLPSYRAGAMAVIKSLGPAASDAATAAPAEGPAAGNALRHYRSHIYSIFTFGLSRYLLFFAALCAMIRRNRERSALAGRHRSVLLGGFIIGAVILAAPTAADQLGETVARAAALWIGPAIITALLAFAVAAMLRGDQWDRMLGVWFVVGFLPVLFLKHGSNAYHLLAFTALALFTTRALAPLIAEELRPAIERLRGLRPEGMDDDARAAVAALLLLLAGVQGWMLFRNTRLVHGVIAERSATGRLLKAAVEQTVRATLEHARERRRAVVSREEYASLAGLILRAEHRFETETLEQPGAERVGLRTYDAPLRVYTDALAFDETLFRRFNVFPDPSFESPPPGLPVAAPGRTGRQALLAENREAAPRTSVMDLGPFGLRSGTAYVFGGFLRAEAKGIATARMALRSTVKGGYAQRTSSAALPGWALVWECAAVPAGEERFMLRAIEAEGLAAGRVLADDLFFCPVAPLIEAARRAEGLASPGAGVR